MKALAKQIVHPHMRRADALERLHWESLPNNSARKKLSGNTEQPSVA
jgi:hypothetical protein